VVSSSRNTWIQRQLVMLGLFAAAIGVGIFAGRTKEIVKCAAATSSGQSSTSAPSPRESDEEMEQRMRWHWAAINKCEAKGFYAVMGFNNKVICLGPGSWAWVYDGKGPP
jgi:hypothetical protein